MAKKEYSYNVNDPYDIDMAIDGSFSELNKKGRRKKKRMMFKP